MQVDSSSAADLLGYDNKKVTSEEDKKQTLAQDDFITLMLSQFQNQDPFNPQDNGEFLAQMAQFSTVEGIGDMQKSMEAMVSGMKSSQVLEASNLVGKAALVESSNVNYYGQGVSGSVDLPIKTQSVRIEITSDSGANIESFTVNNVGPGLVDFYWNGLDESGSEVPNGKYHINATFFNGDDTESTATFIRGNITSVSLDGSGVSSELDVAGIGAVELDNIREISAAQ